MIDYAKRGNVNKLPAKVGVYLLRDKNNKTIYIGKSTNIKERVKTHLKNSRWSAVPSAANPLSAETKTIGYIITKNEPEALIKESELIKKHKPRYNIMLRDDKQYFYVGFIPQENKTRNKKLKKSPYLTITHQPKTYNHYQEADQHRAEKPVPYIGPFTDGGSIKIVLRYLRKIFPYYTKPHGNLPCQYCHIELCPGPNPNIEECKKNILQIKQILNGRKPRVITSLKKEMKKYSDNLEFEKADIFKRQILALENIFSHNFQMQMANDKSMPEIPIIKTKKFGFEKLGFGWSFGSLEAYDISNIQGKEPVASMVRFDNGKPNKKMYRKFRIRLPEKPDDFAMMREAIRRRLRHPEWPYPDLFLIDGGKGQLSAALSAISLNTGCKISNTRFAALAKQENELFIPGRKESIKLADMDAKLRNLLMYARDESHRFAVTYHRKLHRKKSML
ncbi:MAG: hypothetical protein A3B96_01590 [Candidatus Spechtbacteria bacterium RIFCSPHIGHO2_02_FULL_43_15b]|nr:MAG: hypothetical protein A3B96_01590 [Candidatus Spechtbacteria bacterium RIFCSPHIGHO2_02_FULL_43_15b]